MCIRDSFNTDTWDTITVPGAWQLQGYGKPIYSTVYYPFQKDAPKVTSEPPAEYYSYGHRNPTGSYVTTFEVTLDMKRPQRRSLLLLKSRNAPKQLLQHFPFRRTAE